MKIYFTLTLVLLGFKAILGQDPLVTDKVYFDMTIGGEVVGRIVIGLFGNVVNKTVTNFKKFCTVGYNGRTYTGSYFFRVISDFMMQGGDVTAGTGSGSCGKKFADENFIIKGSEPGMLGMANIGPNTNGCQFFITFVKTDWLDGKHVFFGKVVEGLDVVMKVDAVGSANGTPSKPVVIQKCGILS